VGVHKEGGLVQAKVRRSNTKVFKESEVPPDAHVEAEVEHVKIEML